MEKEEKQQLCLEMLHLKGKKTLQRTDLHLINLFMQRNLYYAHVTKLYKKKLDAIIEC